MGAPVGLREWELVDAGRLSCEQSEGGAGLSEEKMERCAVGRINGSKSTRGGFLAESRLDGVES
jgi:hypothetical protein